jgi:hypothetical protein
MLEFIPLQRYENVGSPQHAIDNLLSPGGSAGAARALSRNHEQYRKKESLPNVMRFVKGQINFEKLRTVANFFKDKGSL